MNVMHPLDYNPRQILAALMPPETVAMVAKSVAPEIQSKQDFSNNSNYSGELELLEKKLSRLREQQQACVGFEYKPFKRNLSPQCIAAGKKALKVMQQQIQSLEQEIQRLK